MEKLEVGQEVWVRTVGTAEEWNLAKLTLVDDFYKRYKAVLKCTGGKPKKYERHNIRTKDEHNLIRTKELNEKDIKAASDAQRMKLEIPEDNREFEHGEPVMVQLDGGSDEKIECAFMRHSPNKALIEVRKLDGKRSAVPAERVWKSCSKVSSVDVQNSVDDHLKKCADRANKNYLENASKDKGSAFVPEQFFNIDTPAIDPHTFEAIKDCAVHTVEGPDGVVRFKVHKGQIYLLECKVKAEVEPEPEEEPVEIYRDIDWSTKSPSCEAPWGKFLSVTSYPLFYTHDGYVFKGYLFRENLPHIDKDSIRSCPFYFDMDGRVQYAADAAVFVKLGEVGK